MVGGIVYCWSARILRRASFLAAASFPRSRVEVGMVRVEAVAPAAAVPVRTSPPAVVKLAAEMGSRRKIG